MVAVVVIIVAVVVVVVVVVVGVLAHASQEVGRIDRCLTVPSYCRERAGLNLGLFSNFLTGGWKLSIEMPGKSTS